MGVIGVWIVAGQKLPACWLMADQHRDADKKSCSHKNKKNAAANTIFLLLKARNRYHSRAAKPQRFCAYFKYGSYHENHFQKQYYQSYSHGKHKKSFPNTSNLLQLN